MTHISKALKFIGLEILISIVVFVPLAALTWGKIESGSKIETIVGIFLVVVITAVSIYLFDKKFIPEDTLNLPTHVGLIYLLVGLLLMHLQTILWAIISFVALYLYLKFKFRTAVKK